MNSYDENDTNRAYWVEVTEEGKESKAVGPFDTSAEAIKEARSIAWEHDELLVVVNDDLGDEHWNNEGDWRNAPSAQTSSGI